MEIEVTEKRADRTRHKRKVDPMKIAYVIPKLRECVVCLDSGEGILIAEDADELGRLIRAAETGE